ncbi:hypothetical protein GF369_01585 [Candidatus Peregrinibacteria bacterium]|nr:hypothetical protein [Candidatus Peregrinibacteria bacterium]
MKTINISTGLLFVILSFVNAIPVNANMLAHGISESSQYTLDDPSYKKNTSTIPPQAVLRVRNNTGNLDQLSGTTQTVFTFDGNGSSDEETPAHLLEVRFDFENDGEIDTYFSVTRSVEHTYETRGLNTVRMEVLDREGNVSSTTQKIYIVENTPPEARISATPTLGTPGVPFSFDASHSSDSQYRRSLLEYRFDYNGDGQWDTPYSSSAKKTHNFQYPGIKNVIVEVRDPEGSLDTARALVYIRESRPPIAHLDVETSKDSSRITLDAQGSYDPDNTSLSYKWDFDYTGTNDIIWDTGWTSTSQTYATITRSGAYVIRLLIKDIDDQTDEKIVSLFNRAMDNALSSW